MDATQIPSRLTEAFANVFDEDSIMVTSELSAERRGRVGQSGAHPVYPID